jgi:DnaJ domain
MAASISLWRPLIRRPARGAFVASNRIFPLSAGNLEPTALGLLVPKPGLVFPPLRFISFGKKPKEEDLGKSKSRQASHAETEALPFKLSQNDALAKYHEWAKSNTPFASVPRPVSVSSVYLPFWVFTADFYHPELPSYFGGCDRDISGPTMQVYAGHTYPRAMVEVVKTEIDADKHRVDYSSSGPHSRLSRPFTSSFLEIGEAASLDGSKRGIFSRAPQAVVDIEPFKTYEATAWSIARAAYVARKQSLHPEKHMDLARARFDEVESYRVLLPCHIVEYKYLTQPFRVFVNAYSGQCFGIQQSSIFSGLSDLGKSFSSEDAARLLRRIAETDIGRFLPPAGIAAIVQALSTILRPMVKFLLWPPFVLTAVVTIGGYAAVKGTSSLRAQRAYFMEWEETKKTEEAHQATMSDSWAFRPSGTSARERRREAEREMKREKQRREEEEAWRRQRQREEEAAERAKKSRWGWSSWGGGSSTGDQQQQQQQQQQRTSTSSSSTSGAGAKAKAKPTGRMPPAVNANDYYAVLGIKHLVASGGTSAVTTEEISKAFRRELMKYHPDSNRGEGGYDQEACTERTRQIIAAYGTLRDANKRKAYDATYR